MLRETERDGERDNETGKEEKKRGLLKRRMISHAQSGGYFTALPGKLLYAYVCCHIFRCVSQASKRVYVNKMIQPTVSTDYF